MVPRDVPTHNAHHSLHWQHDTLEAAGRPSQQRPHVRRCPASGPVSPSGPGHSSRVWTAAVGATYNSPGEDLCHTSSFSGKRRNCCFLSCEQQGRLGGTQDIFPSISGLTFKKQKPQLAVPAVLHGEFCSGHRGTAAQHRGCVCQNPFLMHWGLIAVHHVRAI